MKFKLSGVRQNAKVPTAGRRWRGKARLHDPLLPGLADDMARLCLARIPFVMRGAARGVCRAWRQALAGPELQRIRAKEGLQDALLCVCLGDAHSLGRRCILFQAIDLRLQLSCLLPPLPTPWLNCLTEHVGYKCVSLSDSFIVIGGSTYSRLHGIDSNDVSDHARSWIFSFTSNSWQELPPRLCPPHMHPVVTLLADQRLFVIANGLAARSSVEILDVRSRKWQFASTFPGGNGSPMWCAPSLSSPKRVLVAAGRMGYAFDTDTGQFSVPEDKCDKGILQLPTPSVSAVTVNGEVVSISHPQGRPWMPPKVVRFNRDSGEWEVLADIAARRRRSWEESSRYFMAVLGESLLILESWIDFQLGSGGEAASFVEVFMTRLHTLALAPPAAGRGGPASSAAVQASLVNLKVAGPVRSALAVTA